MFVMGTRIYLEKEAMQRRRYAQIHPASFLHRNDLEEIVDPLIADC